MRGHVTVPRGPALPLPLALAFVGFALLAISQYWRRGGFFRLAARRSGWMRGAAIVASLGAVSFGVFTALGFTTLGIAGWLVGGLSSALLLISRKAAPAPPRDPLPARPPEPRAPTDPDEDDDASAFRWL